MTDLLDSIRGKVLLVSYGGGHAAALAPVALDLQRRGIPFAILGLTTAPAYFARHGLTALGIADFVNSVPGYETACAIGRLLAADQPRHALVSASETAAYLGVGYKALEIALGEQEARRRYAALGRQIFRPVDFFQRLFEAARPSAVVATSAPRSERAAMEAAAAARIPSLCVVDLYASAEIEWCAMKGYADKICVLNDEVAERFRTRNVPEECVVVTGNPAFDRLGQLDVAAIRERYRSEHNLAQDDQLLLWISQPEPASHPSSSSTGDPALPVRIEKYLANAFEADPGVHIVMRLHPSEDRPPAASGPRLRYSTAVEPLDTLLCAADCIVTCGSTVGLEAGLLRIPVVQIMESIFSQDLPLADLGFALAAPNTQHAIPLIRDALNTSGTRGHANTSFNAAAHVADLVADLASGDT
ncbi:UDP-N-acetylglucosamine 2-epimerase [Sphingomonas sp. C3-2]|uniref:UDP-N-acetylglucosamine 2-epimerase n=1 Tax=Sphingomonas sp. C3-2 TaxID=3062169 RepID=UPI00294AF452|nr:UDP-N-acetylglucosamine 2-epimerase [Sphingomonas sp. C3-2]WOK35100.1 UDP-N-acetylglucosamine 2-epimerase [Sphingomonas sp. C3-2]